MTHVTVANTYFGVVQGTKVYVETGAALDLDDGLIAAIEADQPGTFVGIKNEKAADPAVEPTPEPESEPEPDTVPVDEESEPEPDPGEETRALDAPPSDRMVKKASKRTGG